MCPRNDDACPPIDCSVDEDDDRICDRYLSLSVLIRLGVASSSTFAKSVVRTGLFLRGRHDEIVDGMSMMQIGSICTRVEMMI